MRAEVLHAVAFADGAGGGNPCPVVFGADDWTDAQLQAAAAAFGHETCFVLDPTADEALVRLRYFVPNHEMEMCVHATVAAAVVLGLPDDARVQTPLGVLAVGHGDGARPSSSSSPRGSRRRWPTPSASWTRWGHRSRRWPARRGPSRRSRPRDGWRAFTIAQGRAMGRPSLIEAQARREGGRVVATRVGGTAAQVGGREPLATPGA